MDLNLYKVKIEKNLIQLVGFLISNNYKLEKSKCAGNIVTYIFSDAKDKEKTEWLSFLETIYEINIEESLGQILSYIIIFNCGDGNIFAAAFGNSYTIMPAFCDEEFGMNFAERQINNDNYMGKKVNYYLQNKKREISTFEKDLLDLPLSNQSYREIEGMPLNNKLFGKSISCSNKVKFKIKGKNFSEKLEHMLRIVQEVPSVLHQRIINKNIPRMKPVSKKNIEMIEELNNFTNQNLKENCVDVNFSGIAEIDNSYKIIGIEDLSIYLYKRYKKNNYEFNTLEDVIDVIVNEGFRFEDFKVSFNDEKKDLLEFLDITINYENQTYVLTNKNWYYFNDSYVTLLENQLDKIPICLNDDKLQTNNMIRNEENYLNTLSQKQNYQILHKKLITKGSTKIEIADLYDVEKNALLTVKMGLQSKDTIYSLQQSIIAISALKNLGEYNCKTIENSGVNIKNLKETNEYAIIWALIKSDNKNKTTAKTYLDSYNNNDFELKTIGSMLIKIKLVEWYNIAENYKMNPKIYITKVNM
ncbi:DUF6119 family protein [Staphylococcus caprae]|uniref:DUF6119 family protein n=1 Tax=Staphylococcus caprae TaxID=29380 RepID=UPI003B221410